MLRFWREGSPTAGRWRGRIEHVQSGQRVGFVELTDILGFVRGLGIMAQDRSAPPETEE